MFKPPLRARAFVSSWFRLSNCSSVQHVPRASYSEEQLTFNSCCLCLTDVDVNKNNFSIPASRPFSLRLLRATGARPDPSDTGCPGCLPQPPGCSLCSPLPRTEPGCGGGSWWPWQPSGPARRAAGSPCSPAGPPGTGAWTCPPGSSCATRWSRRGGRPSGCHPPIRHRGNEDWKKMYGVETCAWVTWATSVNVHTIGSGHRLSESDSFKTTGTRSERSLVHLKWCRLSNFYIDDLFFILRYLNSLLLENFINTPTLLLWILQIF